MSWSVSLSGMRAKDWDSQLDTQTRNIPSIGDNASGETREQFTEASDMARALVDSGAVGNPDKYEFNVYLSGHSNTEHNPAQGMANDQVTVTVSQSKLIEE